MSRKIEPPRIYHNQQLMHDYNELQVRIKVHLFELGDEKYRQRHPKPTNEEIDQMMNRVMSVLRQDSRPVKS